MAQNTSLNSALSSLETNLDLYLVKKAPAIPASWKELIVKIAPWLTLLMVIFSIPAVLVLFGISAITLPFSFMASPYAPAGFSIAMVFLVVVIVLEALAIPGLFKRTRAGWNFVFWSTLVGAVSNVISLNIGGFIVGTLLSLYILFQIKSYYK